MMKILRSVFLLTACLLFYNGIYAQAPVISQLSPADNAASVSITANLFISFDQPIQLGEGNISIMRQSDGTVFEVIDVLDEDRVGIVFDNAIQINPTDTLALATSYYVIVDAGAVTSLSGEPFAGISDPTRWNFTTGCGVAPGNIRATNITDVSATLSWNPINGASGYDIQIGTGDIISVTTNSYQAVNLSPNTPYSFKVRTRCANGTFSVWSKVVNFTTNKACEDIVPGGLNARFVTHQSAVLSWTALNVSEYELHIHGVGYFKADTNSFFIDSLNAGVKYAWQVKAKCSDTTYSEFSAYSRFTTTVPGCETTVPVNLQANEADITGESATLRWDATPGAADYRVHVYGRGTFTASSNSITVSGLASGTTYAWRVMSRCSNDLTSEYTDYARFTTTTPGCDPIVPQNLQANSENITESSAILSWDPVPGVYGYRVLVYGVGTFSTGSNSLQVNNLSSGKSYSWKIQSKCSAEVVGNWSSYSRFVTKVTGCEAIIPENRIANDAEISTESAILRWDPVAGAVGYQVHVYKVGTFYPTTNSIEITGLAAGKIYSWRIRSKCSADLGSEFSSYSNFTTKTEMVALANDTKLFNSATSKISSEELSEYQLNLNLYPIPSTDVVNVSLETGYNEDKITSIVITNPQGKVVKRLNNISSQYETLSLREFGSGIYFIGITVNDSHYQVRKVLIE